MTREELISQIRKKQSFLCVGLDPEWDRIPPHLLEKDDPVFEFNKAIIDATRDLCVAYKPNLAFYESMGLKGWNSLEKTLAYIPSEHFTIADAKRGDIGNTSRLYARAFFETLDFDAITVAPYMGSDSVLPFLEFEDKWVILLALTSNAGSLDFQMQPTQTGEPLFSEVMRKAQEWGSPKNLMFVVGATHPSKLAEVRQLAPDHFFLVPGVGAQGGDLQAVMNYGMNADCGLLVNSSRGIIFAGNGEDFAEKAREAAAGVQLEMAKKIS
ncbi:MAG: orotidine-5'-phosphate decarboxylase [Saprospirales bacterium]|nr:orotidine-5'-phosphate decarboxylase [Saprospirales bacterium]